MTSRVLIIGNGVLADSVCKLLSRESSYRVQRFSKVPHEKQFGAADIHLVLVLDDAWNPAAHAAAEDAFRSQGIPWLRGFVAMGIGVIGPLVHPEYGGCSECADVRTMTADADARELMQLKSQLSLENGYGHDVYGSSSGLLHLARLLVEQVKQIVVQPDACRVSHHVIRTHLKTLNTTRHYILPVSGCPVCGTVSVDSAEASVMELNSSPKTEPDSFRSRKMVDLQEDLLRDYLDRHSGLLNGKVQDLITPFAAVSVNLPTLMGDEGTSGRAHSYLQCEPIAILEGLERYCGIEPRGKRTVVFDSYENLKQIALNPVSVGLHAPENYRLPDFPFQPFDSHLPMDWVWGYSLTKARPLLVPQRIAYYSLGYPDAFVYETSNGCAVGGSLVEAIFHGILEIVERDSFLMTWYAKLPLRKIDLAGHDDLELQWMIERIRYVTGYDLHFYNGTMENSIPTVFVIAKNRRSFGLNLLCSAGAHVDPMRAIKGAIQETAGMLLRFDEKLESQRASYLEMLRDSSQVRHMEDHSMLYGLPEAQTRFDFLWNAKQSAEVYDEAFTWDNRHHPDLKHDLSDVVGIFERLNLDVIVVNQTAPEIARRGLHCVKVLIPGMLPMTFGHHLRRLEHLDRVLNVPMKLGFTDKPLTKDQLNPYPHPFP